MNRRRFTLTNVLLVTTCAAFALALYVKNERLNAANRRIVELQADLDRTLPISFWSVKHQFIRALKHITPTHVESVSYSPLRDSYRIEYSWINPATKEPWNQPVDLKYVGDGRYSGELILEPYADVKIDSNGDKIHYPMTVTIKDDVARSDDLKRQHGFK